jgi:hypothetical protein
MCSDAELLFLIGGAEMCADTLHRSIMRTALLWVKAGETG